MVMEVGKGMTFVQEDIYCIKLKDTNNKIIPEFKKDEIYALNINNEVYISKFFPISINNKEIFKPRYFKYDKNTQEYLLYRDIPNISSLMILPLILNYSYIQPILPQVLNLYSFIENNLEDEFLYFVCKYINTSMFLQTESKISKLPFCKEIIDLDKFFIAFKFEIPINLQADIEIIKRSKYSLISRESKKKIYDYYMNFLRIPSFEKLKVTKIYNVLEKKENYRKKLEKDLNVIIPSNIDLYEGFNDIKETYLDDMKYKESNIFI